MSKAAIISYSDPGSGSEEALGRLFNALFLGYEKAIPGTPGILDVSAYLDRGYNYRHLLTPLSRNGTRRSLLAGRHHASLNEVHHG